MEVSAVLVVVTGQYQIRAPVTVISQEGIEMDPEKVSAVLNWEVPKTIQDVQCFLGFANFYRRFIEGYSRICTPLFNLLKTVDKDK